MREGECEMSFGRCCLLKQVTWDRSFGTDHLGQVVWDRSFGTGCLGHVIWEVLFGSFLL